MASATSEFAAGGGPANLVRRLYAKFHDIDDGTWWTALQPGARGFGIMPWYHSDQLNIGDFYYHLQNGLVYGAEPPGRTPGLAFVEWSRDAEDWSDMYLRILNVSCYERSYTQPLLTVDPDFMSAVANCLVSYETHSMNGEPQLWVPVWAVTPIDDHYFWQWSSEAEELWGSTTYRRPIPEDPYDDYDELLMPWVCCGDYPTHLGEHHLFENAPNIQETCRALIYSECPCRVEGHLSELSASCEESHTDCACSDVLWCDGYWRLIEIRDDICDCGLNDARNKLAGYLDEAEALGLATENYCIADLVTVEEAIFAETVNYSLDSYFRGWQRCAELAQAEAAFADTPEFEPNNLEHNWFFSLWQRSAPFLDFSGPARQAARQLPLSISSATLRAS